MKFIFLADVHLDSGSASELIRLFKNATDYAKKIGAGAVVLGGDLFDSPFPAPETAAAVRNIILSAKPIQFIAVCGNHDPLALTEFYKNPPENLYVFPSEITRYEFSGTVFYGVSENSSELSQDVWSEFTADGRFITLSHGNIKPASLAKTGAALCLLGHIHKSEVHTLANGAVAIYSGCLAGRGFDECGEKGFYVIDSENMNYEFIFSGGRVYREYRLDISGVYDIDTLIREITDIIPGENEIARLVLYGKVAEPLQADTDRLCTLTPFVQIKDESEFEPELLCNTSEYTLEGEFIRILKKRLESASDTEAQMIKDAIKEGLIALRRKK